MSTLKFTKNNFSSTAPKWTCSVPERLYHNDARRGKWVSSTMLKEFRRCPAHYYAIVNGTADPAYRKSFRLGKAVHKRLLEGEAAFRGSFVIGGPFNEITGRAFAHGTQAFRRWADEYGLDPEYIVTPAEEEAMRRMAWAVRGHGEAARLLSDGWAEQSVRAEIGRVACQARLDWLREDGVVVDLKTCSDLGRFEDNARRFGYLNQFAFYRDVARAAGGGDLEMVAVVVENKAPFRVGVWRFDAAILEPYAVQNREALRTLERCRREKRWPTGYEGARAFPPVGLPPLWLN